MTKLIIEELGVTVTNDTIKEFVPFFSESLIFYIDYYNNVYVKINEDGSVLSSDSSIEKIGDEVTLNYDKSYIIIKSDRVSIIGYSDVIENNTNLNRIVNDINDSFQQKELLFFILNKMSNKANKKQK